MPKPEVAIRAQQVTQLFEAAAMVPKTKANRSDRFQAHRLPIKSQPRPQKEAPTIRPEIKATIRKPGCFG